MNLKSKIWVSFLGGYYWGENRKDKCGLSTVYLWGSFFFFPVWGLSCPGREGTMERRIQGSWSHLRQPGAWTLPAIPWWMGWATEEVLDRATVPVEERLPLKKITECIGWLVLIFFFLLVCTSWIQCFWALSACAGKTWGMLSPI